MSSVSPDSEDAVRDGAAARTPAPPSRTLALRTVYACIGLGAIVVLPTVLAEYWVSQVTLVAIYAIATMGLSLLFGRTGQLSLAQAAFFGLGAYSAGVLGAQTAMPLPVELLAVIAISAIAGVIVGLPALRTSGLRLAVVTLMFGQVFVWGIVEWRGVTGGESGLFVNPATLGPFTTADGQQAFYLAVGVGLLGAAIMARVGRTPLGRAMLLVRDSELAARSVGVSLTKTKLIAFSLSAVYAGVAGMLFAHVSLAISPSTFDLFPSVYFLVAVILGGAGTVLGAWLGAAYIVLVPVALQNVGSGTWDPVIGGAILVTAIVLAPEGLTGVMSRALRHGRSVLEHAPWHARDAAAGDADRSERRR